MHRYKFQFRNKSLAEQLNICETTINNLVKLPEEQQAKLDLDGLPAKVAEAAECRDRIAALRLELKAEVSRYPGLVRELRDRVIRNSNMAAVLMKHDPVKMMTLGLSLIAPGRPVGLPAAPRHLRGQPTAAEGEARLRWVRTVRECSFQVEYRLDGTDTWQMASAGYRQSCTVTGLVSGGKYWFRVRACNAHGASPWSNEAPVRVK